MYRFTPSPEEFPDNASIRLAFCASMSANACSACAFILIMPIVTCSRSVDWFIATAEDAPAEMSFMIVCSLPRLSRKQDKHAQLQMAGSRFYVNKKAVAVLIRSLLLL